jgi:histidinol-phosphate aminotransferase
MGSFKLEPRPGIEGLVPYDPGKPIEETQRELGLERVIKLASNENPLGPSPKAVEALGRAIGGINRYPDGGCYYLKQRLSKKLGVTPEAIIFGNGSNELIELLFRTFVRDGEKVVYGYPAFVVYRLIAQAMGIDGVSVPLKGMVHDLEATVQAVGPGARVVFVSNPNNPTGTMVTHEEVMAFIEKVPEDVILVFDEAYYEFVPPALDFPKLVPELLEMDRPIVVMRTFSKLYGLAGVRVGYGIAHPEIIELMNRVRQPFNVNSLAQVAALAALEDEDHVARSQRLVWEEMLFLEEELGKMGVETVPSVANFLLVKVGDGNKTFQELLRKGVIVRAMGGYGLHQYVRVTVGTREENEIFLTGLKEVLGR